MTPAVAPNAEVQPDPGSRPLRKPAHEQYARHRSLCLTPRQAVIKLGMSPTSGAMSKLENSLKIQDRIAWLTRQEEELLREKRAKLEQFWWTALEADPKEFWELWDEPIYDSEGEPTGQTRKAQRLKLFHKIPPELRQLIEGLTYTEKGKPNLKVVQKSQANIELRKMLGIDAPARTEMKHSGTVTLEALVLASMPAPQEPAPEAPKVIEHVP